MNCLKYCVFALLIISSCKAISQSDEDLSDYLMDLSVPSSPLLGMIGASTDSVITPDSVSEFGLGILSGPDSSNNFQSGVVFEFAPHYWFVPDKVADLNEYKNKKMTRFWRNLSISIGTSKGQEIEDETRRKGIGIKYTHHFSDPLYDEDFIDCSIDVGNLAQDKQKRLMRQGLALEDAAEKANELANKAFKEKCSWNKTMLSLGIARYKTDEDAKEIDENGSGFWLSQTISHGEKAQYIFHLRYNDNVIKSHKIEDENMLLPTDIKVIGTRVRYGNKKTRGFFEASYEEEKFGDVDDEFTRAAIGVEFEVSKNVIFQAAYGNTFGSDIERDDYFNGQLKWSFAKSSFFD
ncbi:hypothetical protein [Marinicella sp. W31]|uniref:hypothetical protein n=1 Tax=Marinicella sp. W31 TaxID=3023713 RepID=UPI00375809C2